MPLSLAAFTIALAIGWAKCSSRQAAIASTSFSLLSSNAMILERLGAAAVSVPVLSKTTVSARDASSRNFPQLPSWRLKRLWGKRASLRTNSPPSE